MKRSTKITTIIIIFFLVITSVIVARTMIGQHFQKKFGKRPPPGIIVTGVVKNEWIRMLLLIASCPYYLVPGSDGSNCGAPQRPTRVY